MEIGMTIDNKIEDIKGWNRERSWYKLYIYLQLLASEKNLNFNSRLEISNNVGYLYPRHYKKLKKYKKPIVTPYVSNNMTIADPETGATVELKDIPTVTMTSDNGSGYKPFTIPREVSFSGKAEISDRAIEILIGKNKTIKGSYRNVIKELELFVDTMRSKHGDWFRSTHLEFYQNRTHKKHRINKKWAKRYGYTCIVHYR